MSTAPCPWFGAVFLCHICSTFFIPDLMQVKNQHPANPIGIFDSGVGGLTIARAISHLMPNERIVYFGDTLHLPYGDKSAETIKNYSLRIASFLELYRAKAIVVACNSASATAFEALQKEFGQRLLLFNVIDPVVEFASQHFSAARMGIIGTRATIASNTYQRLLKAKDPGFEIIQKPTPLFVPVIEEGLGDSRIASDVISHYFDYPEWKNLDAMILGCTHYPIIQQRIKNYFGEGTYVLDTPEIVARHIQQKLREKLLLATAPPLNHNEFFVSEFTETFSNISRQFFGEEIRLIEQNLWK